MFVLIYEVRNIFYNLQNENQHVQDQSEAINIFTKRNRWTWIVPPSCVSISSTSLTWTGARLSCLRFSWSLTWFIAMPILMVVLIAPGTSEAASAVEVTSEVNWTGVTANRFRAKIDWCRSMNWLFSSGTNDLCSSKFCWCSCSIPIATELASLLRLENDVLLPHDDDWYLLAMSPISAAIKCPRFFGGRPQHIFHPCAISSSLFLRCPCSCRHDYFFSCIRNTYPPRTFHFVFPHSFSTDPRNGFRTAGPARY